MELIRSLGLDRLELVNWLYVPNAVFMRYWTGQSRKWERLTDVVQRLLETKDWAKVVRGGMEKGIGRWLKSGEMLEERAKRAEKRVKEVFGDPAVGSVISWIDKEVGKVSNGGVRWGLVNLVATMMMYGNARLKGVGLLQVDEWSYRLRKGECNKNNYAEWQYDIGKIIGEWNRELGGYPELDGVFALWIRGLSPSPINLVGFVVFVEYWEGLRRQKEKVLRVFKEGGRLMEITEKLKEAGLQPPTVFIDQRKLEILLNSERFNKSVEVLGNVLGVGTPAVPTEVYLQSLDLVDLLIPQNPYWIAIQGDELNVMEMTPAEGKTELYFSDPFHSWWRGEIATLLLSIPLFGRKITKETIDFAQLLKLMTAKCLRHFYLIQGLDKTEGVGGLLDKLIRVKAGVIENYVVGYAFSHNGGKFYHDYSGRWFAKLVDDIIERFEPPPWDKLYRHSWGPQTKMEFCFDLLCPMPYKITITPNRLHPEFNKYLPYFPSTFQLLFPPF